MIHLGTSFVCELYSGYLSSLKLVLVALRLGKFVFSGVAQVSIYGEENVGISSCAMHVTCPYRHLVGMSCDRRKMSSCAECSHCVKGLIPINGDILDPEQVVSSGLVLR